MNALLVKSESRVARDSSLEQSGKLVRVNRDLASRVQVEVLPCIHGMINSSYSVIRSETDRLALKAAHSQLNSQDIRSFERLTASLVRLANLELNVKDQSDLDMESDETIRKLAKAAMGRDPAMQPLREDESDGEPESSPDQDKTGG